jgi:biopolymer transport protein TolQ
MEPSVINTTPMLGQAAAAAHDMSVWGLFLQADIIVKIVLLLLVAASIWCWTIIFEKWIRVRRLNRRANGFEEAFWSGGSLDDLYDQVGPNPPDPMSATFAAGMKEWRLAADRGFGGPGAMRVGLQERIDRVMQVTATRELGRAERGMTVLASVGSTAPFIGLLGTVWGIMNSFQSIAASADTSLAVVAPGIAEALFATAIGLFAAIPASVGYNKFSNDLNKYAERLETFAGEFHAILSRYLEDRG